MALPLGLTNIAASYQDALSGKFANQISGNHPTTDQLGDVHPFIDLTTNQAAPMINMVAIHQFDDESLHTILEETPSPKSQGSTKTISETPSDFPPFPPGFEGRIFHVSTNEPSRDGENDEERQQRLNRNANRVQR